MLSFETNFFSHTLQLNCKMHVLLPEPGPGPVDPANVQDPRHPDFAGYPTLYLLHGLQGNHNDWMRWTSIERYARTLNLAVIMPAVDRSFYCDLASGARYWAYISDEVPALCRAMFKLSPRREDTYVAGLSMGGYGAFKLAFNRPEMFAAAASLSGALRVDARFNIDSDQVWRDTMTNAFGDQARYTGSINDLMHMATQRAKATDPTPPLYQACGTDDFLYQQNTQFRDHARSLGLDLTYVEHPGYGHTWDYWDMTIQDTLAWFMKQREAAKAASSELSLTT